MWCRFAAPLAELAKLDTFTSIRLVLRGDVVTPLARLACERDRRSLVTHRNSLRSFRWRRDEWSGEQVLSVRQSKPLPCLPVVTSESL